MPVNRFAKCSVPGCNQHRTSYSTMCGTHVRDAQQQQERTDELSNMLDTVDAVLTIDELKSILKDIIRKVYDQ